MEERKCFRGERKGVREREVRVQEELVNIREVIREKTREVGKDNKEESKLWR